MKFFSYIPAMTYILVLLFHSLLLYKPFAEPKDEGSREHRIINHQIYIPQWYPKSRKLLHQAVSTNMHELHYDLTYGIFQAKRQIMEQIMGKIDNNQNGSSSYFACIPASSNGTRITLAPTSLRIRKHAPPSVPAWAPMLVERCTSFI